MLRNKIAQLISKLPTSIDLTLEAHSQIIDESVKTILQEKVSFDEVELIEKELLQKKDKTLIFVLLILKIVKSNLLLKNINRPIDISLVFAVYNEHNRIKKNREHPHGEDFLLRKVQQLQNLFNKQPLVNWKMLIVDDGCPNNTGKIAQEIIDKNNLNEHVRVLYIKNAIDKKLPPVQSLYNTSDSQKGGAIVYGMWDAVQQNSSNEHFVVYTDADLSTHLGQLMLLINPLLDNQKKVAIASRREADSVVIKGGSRNDRGKLFIYLWKRMIPNLGDIIDTQCGFKAFNASILPDLIKNLIEKKFAFDIELLLKAAIYDKDCITKVPIAWIDSEAASTTTDLQPYLPMLKSIAKMSEMYFSELTTSKEYIRFIQNLDNEVFKQVLARIPKEIIDREPIEFTTYDGVKAKDLLF